MSRPVVVIADTDESYVTPLELKVVEELGETSDIEIITDIDYFNEYFSGPRTIDVLIVCEELYSQQLKRHNISHIRVLAQNCGRGAFDDGSVGWINKYSSLKAIYNCAFGGTVLSSRERVEAETQIILICSPIGGVGKTSIALGLSHCLADENKRVLYLNLEEINTFQVWMNNRSSLSESAYTEFRNGQRGIFSRVRHLIRNEGFDYLPPLKASISALGIERSALVEFVREAKEKKVYDYILMDTDSVFREQTADLIEQANRIFLLTMQDQVSVFKMDTFLENVNCNDPEKYTFICNRYDSDRKNCLKDEKKAGYVVGAYIYEEKSEQLESCEDIARISGLRDLAFLLL